MKPAAASRSPCTPPSRCQHPQPGEISSAPLVGSDIAPECRPLKAGTLGSKSDRCWNAICNPFYRCNSARVSRKCARSEPVKCIQQFACAVLCIFPCHPLNSDRFKMIYLCVAGRPGDRWAGLRKKAGREESPDTVVFAFYAWDESLRREGRLRLKGNAPGNARGLTLRAVRASEARFRLRTVPQKINRRCNAPRWPSEGKPSDRPESSPRKRVAEGDSAW